MTELQRDWQKKKKKKEFYKDRTRRHVCRLVILQRQNKTACLPSCKKNAYILCEKKKYFHRKSVEVQPWTSLELILNEFCLLITVRCMQVRK